jgi:serine/threonine-protein kinase HipA
MGHSPEDCPRAEPYRQVAEPTPRASSSGSILTAPSVFILVAIVITLPLAATEALIMKRAHIYQQSQLAGLLEARDDGTYRFMYDPAFHGEPVSLTMPTGQRVWEFSHFPAPFEGLLPEGVQLDALLRLRKLDSRDLFGQLLAVGRDVVGSLRIEAAP